MSFCGHCGRENGPKRRYCGGCGSFIAPVCRDCDFADNEVGDRFCGGCGGEMSMTQTKQATASNSNRELAGLFVIAPAAKKAIELPETNVSQDDVDRLFGKGAS